MPTHCSATGMAFGRAGGRELVAEFDGGRVTSEAGALLLGATDQAIRLVDRFASCFRDGRHAVKAFARLRNVIGSCSTPKGIREYLILLSISETCRYKGVSFLNFLRSGELNIDTFAARSGARVIPPCEAKLGG